MVYDARGGKLIYPDPVLSNISVGFNAGNTLVGEALFPPVRVNKRAGKYYVFGLEAWQLPFQGDIRAPATVANEVPGVTLSSDSFFCNEHALQHAVPDEEEEQYAGSPLNPLSDAVELITGKILLGREVAMRDHVYTDANYPADQVVTLSGTSQFNDYTNSDPIAVFRTAFRKMYSRLFREPNVAIIPYEVMLTLEDHPKIIARMASTERQVLTADLIANVLGVERVIVPGTGFVTNANPPAQPVDPSAISYVWGKNILLAYVPPRPAPRTPAFGYEFVQPINGLVQASDRWYEKDRKATVVRVARRYDLKMVTKDSAGKNFAGYLIKNAIA